MPHRSCGCRSHASALRWFLQMQLPWRSYTGSATGTLQACEALSCSHGRIFVFKL